MQRYNIVTVRLRRPVDLAAHHRGFAANASCGLCGKAKLEQVEVACGPVGPRPESRTRVPLAPADALAGGSG